MMLKINEDLRKEGESLLRDSGAFIVQSGFDAILFLSGDQEQVENAGENESHEGDSGSTDEIKQHTKMRHGLGNEHDENHHATTG